MEKTKAVVIAESYDSETQQTSMIQCIGVFDCYEIAYGEAFLYLCDLTDTEDNRHITPLFELEGETGFGLSLEDQNGKVSDTVFVLHAESKQQEGGGEAE